MKTYSNLPSHIWSSHNYAQLTKIEDSKPALIYQFLLTNANSNNVGVYSLPFSVLEQQFGMDKNRILQIMKTLQYYDLAIYDASTQEVFVKESLELMLVYGKNEFKGLSVSDKRVRHCRTVWENIQSLPIKTLFYRYYAHKLHLPRWSPQRELDKLAEFANVADEDWVNDLKLPLDERRRLGAVLREKYESNHQTLSYEQIAYEVIYIWQEKRALSKKLFLDVFSNLFYGSDVHPSNIQQMQLTEHQGAEFDIEQEWEESIAETENPVTLAKRATLTEEERRLSETAEKQARLERERQYRKLRENPSKKYSLKNKHSSGKNKSVPQIFQFYLDQEAEAVAKAAGFEAEQISELAEKFLKSRTYSNYGKAGWQRYCQGRVKQVWENRFDRLAVMWNRILPAFQGQRFNLDNEHQRDRLIKDMPKVWSIAKKRCERLLQNPEKLAELGYPKDITISENFVMDMFYRLLTRIVHMDNMMGRSNIDWRISLDYLFKQEKLEKLFSRPVSRSHEIDILLEQMYLTVNKQGGAASIESIAPNTEVIEQIIAPVIYEEKIMSNVQPENLTEKQRNSFDFLLDIYAYKK